MVVVVALLAVMVTALFQIASGNMKVRIHQHKIATVRDSDVADPLQSISQTASSQFQYDAAVVDVYKLQTHLPIVILNTHEKIPGEIYYANEYPYTRYTVAEDGETYSIANMHIIDNKDRVNSISDSPDIVTDIKIRVRGNTSRHFDKKSYSVKLIDNKGNNSNKMIMGMEENNDWALHGPFLDKTLMRNYMGMNIAGQILDYAPDVRYCEVILNGEYQGLYLMMETVSRGKGRVDISKPDSRGKNVTGYIIELENTPIIPVMALNNFTQYSSILRKNAFFNIEYPGTSLITPELKDYIERDVSIFEKALYSYDYNTSDYGFQNYVDVDEFVKYFILMEVFLQVDTGNLSTYFYKDAYGLYRPCVWDFNNSLDNTLSRADDVDVLQFVSVQAPWFWMMVKSDNFVEQIIAEYHRLRKGILSDEYLSAYIEDTKTYLGHSAERNYAVWGYSFNTDYVDKYNRLSPISKNPQSYDEAIQQMEDSLLDRLAWLDENIAVLRQYGHKSAVKRYDH
jgi:hypothetical protein